MSRIHELRLFCCSASPGTIGEYGILCDIRVESTVLFLFSYPFARHIIAKIYNQQYEQFVLYYGRDIAYAREHTKGHCLSSQCLGKVLTAFF